MQHLIDYINEAFNYSKNGDEFYTRLQDIEKELSNYNFSDKKVYCNCDNPKFSNFWKYFHDNFDKLKLKQLDATYYDDKNPLHYIYDGDEVKTVPIKSGRFQDNVDILKQCDIVVTNPPYSDNMPIELTELCLNNHKQLIFVGPLHYIMHKTTFDWFKANKIHAGYTRIGTFNTPSGQQKNAPSAWWTTFDVEHPLLKTGKKFEGDDKYKHVDAYDAIVVSNVKDIPDNYYGTIATSIAFITKVNVKQFDVIKYDMNCKVDGKRIMTKLIVKRNK